MKKSEGQKAVFDIDGKEGWRSMLSAIPFRNSAAEVLEDSDSELSIMVKSQKKAFPVPLSWIVPQRKDQVLKLDRIGRSVWNSCDGNKTVETVIEEFAHTYRLTFHESRVAVTNYLKRLIQRGAVAIVIDATDTDKKGLAIG